MSTQLCLSCGEMIPADSDRCPNCGAAVVPARAAGGAQGGLPRLAPVVFVIAAMAFGVAGYLAAGLALGVPLGILGGGIGVWMLVRSGRLR